VPRRERESFAALRRRLTPSTAQHRAYLRQVAAYIAECRAAPPRLVHDRAVGRVTALELWRSRLFGRRYLVAYVEAPWYRAAAPASEAMTSTLSGTAALPPLVIVPHRRRRPRSARFRAIIEHEFVHINQAILGTLLASPRGPAGRRLASLFFTRWRTEYEAHALQAFRWPRFFPHGFGLSLGHWCALRGYADALEAIFVAAWRGECRPRDLATFLDRLPGRLRGWLRQLGLDAALASWFRRHLVLHVAVAVLNVARTHPGFGASAAFRTGHRWVGAAAGSGWARRAGAAAVQGLAVATPSQWRPAPYRTPHRSPSAPRKRAVRA
jgi:hypothetical protein